MRAKTLKELAGTLDLSIATVSRALAGHEAIALKTRQRVMQAAKELGYVPNRAARSLVLGRSGFVGLVLPIRGTEVVDMFLGEFLMGFGESLVESGQDLILATAPPGVPEINVLRHVVESGRADGMVINSIAEDDERVHFLADRGFPFVAHGRLYGSDKRYHWLDTDGFEAFKQAFDMLYDLGHRRFGLLSLAEDQTFRRHREEGLNAGIAARSDPSITLVKAEPARRDQRARAKAVREMLAGPERPTAVLCMFDELALTVIEEATRMGLSVPEDLSVTGFDNIAVGSYAPPGLTTFDSDIRTCAREIGEMLLQAIEKGVDEPVHRLVSTPILPRGSHGPVPRH